MLAPKHCQSPRNYGELAMSSPASIEPSLARSLLDQIERLVREAEQAQRPLELDPYRGQLFELFVMAEAADLVKSPAKAESSNAAGAPDRERSERATSAVNEKERPKEPPAMAPREDDLTADGLCRSLAVRWNLADATRDSFTNQKKLSPEHLARMRLLWSVMRMWMEWTYAWERWPEFHRERKNV